MSGGGGSGSSIIAAYAVVRNMFRGGRTSADDERARLDAEELRQVEYTSMGLTVPEVQPRPASRFSFLRRHLRR